MSDSEHTLISAQVPVALRDELHRFAEQNDRSMSSVIRRALHDHLQGAGGPRQATPPPVAPAERRRPGPVGPPPGLRQPAGPKETT